MADNYEHALEPFFGTLDEFQKNMLANDRAAHETYNLPAAYKGKNRYLQDVLNYMITGESDFYMELLPWVETDDLSIKWEVFSFNRTLFDLEPSQGVPRYVTAERESRRDRLVRRGLGFIIEHGFYTTAVGRRHYLMNLRQISDAVTETAAHGVMIALLGAHSHYKQWLQEHGPVAMRAGDIGLRSRRNWGIVQKQERGLYILDADVKDIMRFEGVTPDTIVFPSRMGMYASLVPGSETEYYRKGPGAVANLETGPATFQTFRGLRVHETRPFDIDFVGEPYDLLTRTRQCGDFHVIPANCDKFYIYSMDADRFVDVLPQLGEIRNATGEVKYNKDKRLVIARPFRTYHMASAIWLKRGLETGSTFHGHHSFTLSDDALRKVHIGHYTFWHKSIVKVPKNVMVAEDIFARGYAYGEGHDVINDLQSYLNGGERPGGSIIPIEMKDADIDKLGDGLDISGRYKNPDGQVDLQSGVTSVNILESSEQSQSFSSPLRELNSMCYRGMSIAVFGQGATARRQVTLSKDHWGVNVYPGCRGARTGAMAFLKDMSYEKGEFDKIPLQ